MSREPDSPIVRHSQVLGGRPVFRGTRVQAEMLFENLAEGYTLHEIAQNFPTLDVADMKLALRLAGEALMREAPDVTEPERHFQAAPVPR